MIIPVLNEAERILATLSVVLSRTQVEVIVVDGGSQDTTVEKVQSVGVKVICSAPGRAQQMNAGAVLATGDVLLFLHGDTRLPDDFPRWIEECLSQVGVCAGAFQLRFDDADWRLRVVEWGVKWRSQVLQFPYGDQGLFLSRQLFHELGGFPLLPMMEDFALIHRLRQRGKIAIAPVPVLTSARRYRQLGIGKTVTLNQLAIAAYFWGVPPAKIAQWYQQRPSKQS